MVLVLALVAGVIYLVVYFLRRMGKPRIEQNPHLKILASTHLGSGRYVHVVSVGKEAWLIGSGEGGVNHIAPLADQETIDAMALDASKKKAETPEPFSFQAMLKKFSGGLSAKEKNRLENMRERREKFKRF
jgi:flagellar biosynthetic protein FliO